MVRQTERETQLDPSPRLFLLNRNSWNIYTARDALLAAQLQLIMKINFSAGFWGPFGSFLRFLRRKCGRETETEPRVHRLPPSTDNWYDCGWLCERNDDSSFICLSLCSLCLMTNSRKRGFLTNVSAYGASSGGSDWGHALRLQVNRSALSCHESPQICREGKMSQVEPALLFHFEHFNLLQDLQRHKNTSVILKLNTSVCRK